VSLKLTFLAHPVGPNRALVVEKFRYKNTREKKTITNPRADLEALGSMCEDRPVNI